MIWQALSMMTWVPFSPLSLSSPRSCPYPWERMAVSEQSGGEGNEIVTQALF